MVLSVRPFNILYFGFSVPYTRKKTQFCDSYLFSLWWTHLLNQKLMIWGLYRVWLKGWHANPTAWVTKLHILLERPSRGAPTSPTRCAQPTTQVCLPCNDHAQPAADKAPTSVTEFLVKLIVPCSIDYFTFHLIHWTNLSVITYIFTVFDRLTH